MNPTPWNCPKCGVRGEVVCDVDEEGRQLAAAVWDAHRVAAPACYADSLLITVLVKKADWQGTVYGWKP